MDVIAHSEYGLLNHTMADLVMGQTHAYKGTLYRFAEYAFSKSADFLSGQGTMKCGTRYGAAKTFPIVYGSTDCHLALRETCEAYKYFGITTPPLNHVIRAFEVSLTVTLDLSSADIRKALGVTRKTLSEENWRKDRNAGIESLTQAIGRAAHTNGIQALLVPSKYSNKQHNVAIFPSNVDGTAYIKLLSDQ